MNIIKLQDQLKGLPDQILAGYVQNPTGEVPTYLALSELQRRKTMREKYQQEQTPTTTVAEDLTAPPQEAQGLASIAPDQMPAQMEQAPQGMAEGGVATLDTGDMYDEKNYATGGIVAFGKGGYAYDPETDNPEDYASMLDQMLAAEEERYRIETPEFGMHPGLAMQHRKKLNELYKIAPTPYDKAIEFYAANNQPGAAGALEAKKREWLYNKEARDVSSKGLTSLDATKVKADGTTQNGKPAQDGKGGYTYQPGESATKSPSDTYFDTLNQFMPKTSAGAGIITDRLKYDPTLYTKGLEDPEAAFQSGLKRYGDYVGENTALKDAQERLKAREDKLVGRDKENIGFSLLAAAAPMFNARTLGEGISKAVPAGVSSYVQGRDKLDDIRDKIDSTKLELAQAQRAEKINTFKYGDDDRRTAKAAKTAAEAQQRLHKLHVDEFNINQINKEKELGLQNQLVDIKRMDLAKDIAFGNRQLAMYEDRIAKMDQATQARYAQIKSKATIEANKQIYSGNVPEIRALIKEFTDQGKKTYGNPEFEGQLGIIKNGIIASYIGDEMGSDLFAGVPSATDLLNRKPTQ
jgi:hypothetical protein